MSALSMQPQKKPALPSDMQQQFEDMWNKSPDDHEHLQDFRDNVMANHYALPTPSNSLGDQIMGGVHKAAQVIDWPFGMLRTGLAASPVGMAANAASQLIQGKKMSDMQPLVTHQDAMNALKGPFGPGAPGMGHYLEKMGVPNDAWNNEISGGIKNSLGQPYSGGIPVASILGFGGDVATSMLPEIEGAEALNPISNYVVKPASKAWYKGGLENELSTIAQKTGKNPEAAADWLMRNQVSGTKGSMMKRIGSANDANSAAQKDLYEKAAGYNSQYYFDPAKAMEPSDAAIAKQEWQRPGSSGDMGKFNTYLKNAVDETPDEIIERNKWLNLQSRPGYGADAATKTQAKLYGAMARGRANEWEDAANAATVGTPDAGLGTTIDKVNNDLSMGLAANKAISKTNTAWYSPDIADKLLVGGGLLGAGVMHAMGGSGALAPELMSAVYAGKKLGDWGLSPVGRTTMGLAGINAAAAGVPDALARQGLLRTPDPYNNPWKLSPNQPGGLR